MMGSYRTVGRTPLDPLWHATGHTVWWWAGLAVVGTILGYTVANYNTNQAILGMTPTSSPTPIPTIPPPTPPGSTPSPTAPTTPAPVAATDVVLTGAETETILYDNTQKRDQFADPVSNPVNYVVHVVPRAEILITEVETFLGSGGNVTMDSTENMFVVSSGTTANSYGLVRTRRYLQSTPGQTTVGRFVMALDADNKGPNSLQGGGMLLAGTNLLVGYDGEDFGVSVQSHGRLEIRTFAITTAATVSSTVSITVGTDTSFGDITVSGITLTVSDAPTNAAEIYRAMVAYVIPASGGLTLETFFTISQEGRNIVLMGQGVSIGGGTSSFSAGTTGTVASWGTNIERKSLEEDWLYMGKAPFFNGGEDLSWLDPNFTNTYEIHFSRMAGSTDFYVRNPTTQRLQLMGAFENDDTNKRMNTAEANFKIGYTASWLAGGSGSPLVVRGGDLLMGTIGVQNEDVDLIPFTATRSIASLTPTPTYLMSLRIIPVFLNSPTNNQATMVTLTAGTASTRGARITLVADCAPVDPVWQYVSKDKSFVVKDEAGTGCTGGEELFSIFIGATSGETVDLTPLHFSGQAGSTVGVFGNVISGSAAATDVGLSWTQH